MLDKGVKMAENNTAIGDNPSERIKVMLIPYHTTIILNEEAGGFEDLGFGREVTDRVQQSAAKVVEVGTDAFMSVIGSLARSFEERVLSLREDTSIDEATLEFGLTVDEESNVYVFKVGSEVNLKVTLKWSMTTQ